jgi:hypothetical protein
MSTSGNESSNADPSNTKNEEMKMKTTPVCQPRSRKELKRRMSKNRRRDELGVWRISYRDERFDSGTFCLSINCWKTI